MLTCGNIRFVVASLRDDILTVQILDSDDELAAHLDASCRKGDLDSILSYLDQGGSSSARISFPWNRDNPAPLLRIALQHGQIELALSLLDHDADISYVDETGANFLAWSLSSADVTRRLLEGGLRPEGGIRNGQESLLYQAALQSRCTPEVISLLLEAGADIELGRVEPYTGRRLSQPVHAAAQCDRLDIIQILVACGANPRALTASGWGLLDSASKCAYGTEKADIGMLVGLISLGLDPNELNGKGYTALHAWAHVGYLANGQTLLRHGADPNIKDRFGETALVIAACQGHAKACELLVQYGADKNAVSTSGKSAQDFPGFPAHLRDKS